MKPTLYLTECPRDAMQGLSEFIPTEIKAAYINTLIQAGFQAIDFGSYVNPKAIPQLADTSEVLERLDLSNSSSKLLAIVANKRGAEDAVKQAKISIIGFPFSVSEEFQVRNTNKSIAQALEDVAAMQALCLAHQKGLRVYLGMAFGNPYGEDYSPELVLSYIDQFVEMGISEIALADTIGTSNPESITTLFKLLKDKYPEKAFIAHLHSTPTKTAENIEAALLAGCTHFDSAFLGFGGCPMAKDELTGNVATEILIEVAQRLQYPLNFKTELLPEILSAAHQVFDLH
jgi:hydroxymethylglutaryl-CoA lyase